MVGYGQLEEPAPVPASVPPEHGPAGRAGTGAGTDADLDEVDELVDEDLDEPEEYQADDEELAHAPRGGLGGLMDGFLGR